MRLKLSISNLITYLRKIRVETAYIHDDLLVTLTVGNTHTNITLKLYHPKH